MQNDPAQTTDATQDAIQQALQSLEENNPNPTQGRWLEAITISAAPLIKEYDLAACHSWADWPEREDHFPETSQQDIGIDAVAQRRSDGAYVAIQCKARQLNEAGQGQDIQKGELDKFVAASSNPLWAERWLVTNGDNQISGNAGQVATMSDPGRPVKLVNLHADLVAQAQSQSYQEEPCPHCRAQEDAFLPDNYIDSNDGASRPIQTKSCMQHEAVAASVRILKEHEQSDTGGLPVGQARGRLILPCGTGKTRISLRIVEELTDPGQLSIVLCPSIALVAQLRQEYLNQAHRPLRALAVCSDQTAGYDPRGEDKRNTAEDPTLDNSNVSAKELKGKVTTDSQEIADWIRQGQAENQESDDKAISVIFGTYQSGAAVAEALKLAEAEVQVLIADEAHRTAGLKKKQGASAKAYEAEQRIRDFTLCHDQQAFPAKYRIYQTATPRIYTQQARRAVPDSDWVVRSMNDESIFGVVLYEKQYVEAVRNEWLSDYKIIALGVNDHQALEQANLMALQDTGKGTNQLTVTKYLKGLAFALAMAGATQWPPNPEDKQDDQDGQNNQQTQQQRNQTEKLHLPIQSCIAFMNTVEKSKKMQRELSTDTIRSWLRIWMAENKMPEGPAHYQLEHLDASSNIVKRDNAKRKLAQATKEAPHAIINVGIFGEGTDSPSLNAIAFLEPRRSPIDVIQAVGRAMRTSPGKETGYIICPIVIPPNADPEQWLKHSGPDDGWKELGDILLALRAHDSRIEDNLADLLTLYVPKPPPVVTNLVAIAIGEDKRFSYREHTGEPGQAVEDLELVLTDQMPINRKFRPVTERTGNEAARLSVTAARTGPLSEEDGPMFQGLNGSPEGAGQPGTAPAAEAAATIETTQAITAHLPEPTEILAGKKHSDGSLEIRQDCVVRQKPQNDGTPGPIDLDKSKKRAQDMLNKGEGLRLATGENRPPRRQRRSIHEESAYQLLMRTNLDEHGQAIQMNLLAKSGLVQNRPQRDANLIEASIKEAAHQLTQDGLKAELERHLGLDLLKPDDKKQQADGCTIAALLLMNAAMLHQRIAQGQWLPNVSDLKEIKQDVHVIRRIKREWDRIGRVDFLPIIEPALSVIETIEDTERVAGLERALRHLAAEAERLAATYADLGADHAGALFNKVRGHQASDGAYFTRPTAASLLARLTLDCHEPQDWTSEETWREMKTIDLACGSGTILAAVLADLKRRARLQGASEEHLAQLQKIAVEDVLKGLDIDPISLQLAAAQLTGGTQDIRYRRMGLFQMPYGPNPEYPDRVSAGTLELISQQSLVPQPGQLGFQDEAIQTRNAWEKQQETALEGAVEAARSPRNIVMNPPFSNRTKVGEKFPKEIQNKLRQRIDQMENLLVKSDPGLTEFVDKNSVMPLFAALAGQLQQGHENNVLSMICPTISLSNTSGLNERKLLAQRYHIRTILTSHQPRNVNMSQGTGIHESIVIMDNQAPGSRVPTRFVHLDRMPVAETEVADLHQNLQDCQQGQIPNGWGEISQWPANQMEQGDWTPAVWRSPELAEAARQFAAHPEMRTIQEHGYSCEATRDMMRKSNFIPATPGNKSSFPIIDSKGADGQRTIRSTPDAQWQPTNPDEEQRMRKRLLSKAGFLMITSGQNTSTARLTTIASDEAYVGRGWLPITGPNAEEAKAVAVFLNSTPGRLQILSSAGRTIAFPQYNPEPLESIQIPNIKEKATLKTLTDCWEATKNMVVPQFRDGECRVRQLWDEAVAEALGWDPEELTRLRLLLHQEPHVRGLGYNQYQEAETIHEEGN